MASGSYILIKENGIRQERVIIVDFLAGTIDNARKPFTVFVPERRGFVFVFLST
jgi:hypothetical protein